MTSSDSTGLVARLRSLDTCAVSDACDRLGLDGFVVRGIVPLTGSSRVAGSVVTLRLGPPQSEEGTRFRHLGAEAVDVATADDVIVVDHQGRLDCAGWGGLLSRAARRRGCAGTLIDGAARDIDEAISIGYAVFAAGSTPRTARGRAVEVEWGGSIIFGGVAVHNGDYVIADSTGVVVVPAEYGAEVIETAASLSATEAAMSAHIENGAPAADVMGTNYEAMLASPDATR